MPPLFHLVRVDKKHSFFNYFTILQSEVIFLPLCHQTCQFGQFYLSLERHGRGLRELFDRVIGEVHDARAREVIGELLDRHGHHMGRVWVPA